MSGSEESPGQSADDLKIRPATERDVPALHAMICELAEFENLLHEVKATESDLKAALFGEQPVIEAVLGEVGGHPVGFALFFHNYSTFTGRKGIYLEDLYIRPDFRRRGFGKFLLRHVAGIARERDCARFEWAALRWNTPAIEAYKKSGAQPMEEWLLFRMNRQTLKEFSESGTPSEPSPQGR